ncbi:MAG: 2Fe-2S iron-sulfur cluster-binding protein [Anaerolineales bacterium]|nr:2Fe-2S iron-sulfur cluster-binding protein [Anaerolineales bacterium]
MNKPDEITLTIDGEPVSTPKDATILEAIESTGKSVPVICYHPATTPEGICRQCVVEVEGWRRLAPSCVTQVAAGMVVHTASERVVRARRTILEMLAASVDLSQAPELQAQMGAYQADPERFPGAKTRAQELIDDNPFYVRDYEKCLMCWRCVQACGDDMQYTYALSIGGRGFGSKIATFFAAPMPETTCVFCGNCVAVCPTNALKDKTEYFLDLGMDYNQIRLEKRKARKGQSARRSTND